MENRILTGITRHMNKPIAWFRRTESQAEASVDQFGILL